MNENFQTAIVNEMSDYVDRVRGSGMRMFPGKKLKQIKYMRERTGFGLKDSKDIVEADENDNRLRIIGEAIKGALGDSRDMSVPVPRPVETPHYLIGKDEEGDPVIYRGQSLEESRRVLSLLAYHFGTREFVITRPV